MIETPAQILEHDASTDAVRSFIAWRKATKKPLTERAALLIAKSLREITGAGGDADEALDLAQEHGWQTIKPHWYFRIKDEERKHDPNRKPQLADRRQDRPNAAIDNIARLAGLGGASGNGGG